MYIKIKNIKRQKENLVLRYLLSCVGNTRKNTNIQNIIQSFNKMLQDHTSNNKVFTFNNNVVLMAIQKLNF